VFTGLCAVIERWEAYSALSFREKPLPAAREGERGVKTPIIARPSPVTSVLLPHSGFWIVTKMQMKNSDKESFDSI